MEAALAHTTRNKPEATYARTDLFRNGVHDERWADYPASIGAIWWCRRRSLASSYADRWRIQYAALLHPICSNDYATAGEIRALP